ncbi:MAG TPA: hypothetical protein VFD90_14870 [Gaiellales bacterium]|nr:hypothetical protein [Gaiellales bacterium]
MRLPSDQHARVSRGRVLRAVLAAVLAALTAAPIAGAATSAASVKSARGDRGVFVSKGVGRQIFTGGGGVAYGVVFSGASLVVADYSATHDMRVDSPVQPTTNVDGSRTYVPAGGSKSAAFRISGTLYRVTVTGASTFNAAGIYGRLQARGKGTLIVNGERSHWNVPLGNLGKVPKDVKKLFQLALSGAPPPAPPIPPTTVPTTTVGP